MGREKGGMICIAICDIRYVKNVERYTASMENGITLSISKRYYKDIERSYIRMKGKLS